eukprot:TRINITY_DN2787_c0_g1_i3.p1 TRINITY_DN2787_c0_g1~~TRINITY_DN2787_c0_g1_i3.p1  ORF type:complete len:226 (+),score=55.30 TRINITY_DN2787_c0_g1_i3:104-781(+)
MSSVTLKYIVVEFQLDNEEGSSEKERSLSRKMKVVLYTNLSQCYLRKSDPLNALHAADHAISLQPDNHKALFRRAKAILSFQESHHDDLRQAVRDLKTSWKLAPDERPVIEREMVEALRRLEHFKKRELPSSVDRIGGGRSKSGRQKKKNKRKRKDVTNSEAKVRTESAFEIQEKDMTKIECVKGMLLNRHPLDQDLETNPEDHFDEEEEPDERMRNAFERLLQQ